MNETEELELNQWLHTVLLGKHWHPPKTSDSEWFCDECKGQFGLHGFNPDYTSSLDLAAIVEAKAIETAGWQVYVDALWGVIASLKYDGDRVKDARPLPQMMTTANAITRCRAARAAVEG